MTTLSTRTRRIAAIAALVATGGGLAATISAAHASSGGAYVAMGDSYSSGEGAGSYLTGTSRDACHRSTKAYSVQAKEVPNPYLVACSGATTADLWKAQGGWPAQMDQLRTIAAKKEVTVVTITMGGNDVGFVTVAKDCAKGLNTVHQGDGRSCSDAVASAERKLPEVKAQLTKALTQIHQIAPKAKILGLGYPNIVTEGDVAASCSVWPANVPKIHKLIHQLNGAMADAARATTSTTYVSTYSAFKGHELCRPWSFGRGNWVRGLHAGDPEAYHPNAHGHTALAKRVDAALQAGARSASRARIANRTAPATAGDDVTIDDEPVTTIPGDGSSIADGSNGDDDAATAPTTSEAPEAPSTPAPAAANHAPVGVPQSVVLKLGRAARVPLTRATDADGDRLTYRLLSQSFATSTHAFGWDPAAGAFTMTPPAKTAPVSLTYVVEDGRGGQSQVVTVSITFVA